MLYRNTRHINGVGLNCNIYSYMFEIYIHDVCGQVGKIMFSINNHVTKKNDIVLLLKRSLFHLSYSPTVDNLPEIKQTKTDLSIYIIFDLLN